MSFLHPQPEDAPCRGDRDPRIAVLSFTRSVIRPQSALMFSDTLLKSTKMISGSRIDWLVLVIVARRVYGKGKGKGKGTVHPITGHEGPKREWRYSSTLSLTSALDGVGGQRHAPAVLRPGKTQYPLYKRLGGSQGRSGWVRKISPPTGIRSPDCPARSESLYRLSYRGPRDFTVR